MIIATVRVIPADSDTNAHVSGLDDRLFLESLLQEYADTYRCYVIAM